MDSLSTLAGKLKLATIICGGVTLGLMVDILGYYFDDKPKTFFAMITIALIISVLLAVATMLRLRERVSQWGRVDGGLHILLGVLLAIGWVTFVIYVSGNDQLYREGVLPKLAAHSSWLAKACFALIFEAINIPLYFYIAFLVLKD